MRTQQWRNTNNHLIITKRNINHCRVLFKRTKIAIYAWFFWTIRKIFSVNAFFQRSVWWIRLHLSRFWFGFWSALIYFLAGAYQSVRLFSRLALWWPLSLAAAFCRNNHRPHKLQRSSWAARRQIYILASKKWAGGSVELCVPLSRRPDLLLRIHSSASRAPAPRECWKSTQHVLLGSTERDPCCRLLSLLHSR